MLNRAVGRMKMFRHVGEFEAFGRVLAEAHQRHPLRILSYCVMSNHWHFVAWPRHDGELTDFFRWLAHTHAMRWRVSHRTVGYGHLYQGRFKSFPVQQDEHLLTLCRYVERNALSAGLDKRAQDWRYGSLWVREHGDEKQRAILCDWPVDRPRDWVRLVNQPLTDRELERVELAEKRSRPLGEDAWVLKTAQKLHLEHTLRAEGRPPKAPAGKGP